MLDIWPELPISVQATGSFKTKWERDDYIAALRLKHRVSEIRLEKVSGSALSAQHWKDFCCDKCDDHFPH
jgi:hypothetical protein